MAEQATANQRHHRRVAVLLAQFSLPGEHFQRGRHLALIALRKQQIPIREKVLEGPDVPYKKAPSGLGSLP